MSKTRPDQLGEEGRPDSDTTGEGSSCAQGDTTTENHLDSRTTSLSDEATVLETVGLNLVHGGAGNPMDSEMAETLIQQWARQDYASVIPGAVSMGATDAEGSSELRLMSVIARGGQGEIWEAIQASLGRVIVVKRAQGDADTRVAFLKEACLSAQLDHPNIVPIYHLEFIPGKDGNRQTIPLLAMKKVTGKSWKDAIAEDRTAPNITTQAFLARHLPILLGVMNAVAYAHAKGIIHRDLKPAQVMLGEFGEVYLLDWGLAVYLGGSVQTESSLAVDPNRMFTLDSASNPSGTPAYMAPEQMLDEVRHLGLHTDIYLLGAILYELLAGTPPHMANNQSQAMELARMNHISPLPDSTPPRLRDLALRCLDTRPENRPTSVLELRNEIQAWLSHAESRSASQRITDELKEEPLAGLEYGALSDLSRKLTAAEREWAENPAIEVQRDRLMEAFVGTALKRHDLIVAQVQARRVSDPELAATLTNQIEEARRDLAESIPSPSLLGNGRVGILVAWGLVVALFVVGVLTQTNRAINAEMNQALSSISEAAAREVSARDVRAINLSREVFSPEFQRMFNQLDLMRRTNIDVEDIYVIQPDNPVQPAIWRMIAHTRPLDIDLDQDGELSSAEQGYAPGDLLEASIPVLASSFRGTGSTVTQREDESGRYIVGLAPVRDLHTGEAVALVGVEIPGTVLVRKMRGIVTISVLGGVTILLLGWVAFLAFFHARNLVQRSRMLADTVEKQNRELSESDLYLG